MATITLTLDTYEFVEKLKRSGMPEQQAKAIADGFKQVNLDNVATKEDLVILRNELREEIQQLRLDLTTQIYRVKTDLFKWSVPILLGQAALIAALVKLL